LKRSVHSNFMWFVILCALSYIGFSGVARNYTGAMESII
jgi:hypothetical protein